MRESIHPIDRVLAEYGVDSQTLALALKVSTEAVRTWRRGTRRITPDAARLTEQRFGVPKHLLRPDLWDAPPPENPPPPDPIRRRSRPATVS